MTCSFNRAPHDEKNVTPSVLSTTLPSFGRWSVSTIHKQKRMAVSKDDKSSNDGTLPKYYQRDSLNEESNNLHTDEAFALLHNDAPTSPAHFYKHFSMEDEMTTKQQRPVGSSRILKLLSILILLILVLFATLHMGGGWTNALFSNTLSHNSCNKGCNVTTANSPKTIMELRDSASIDNIYNGAVASDMSLCSDVGLSILKDLDGNAVDAAVATALCLGVVNPASSGMGGGAMILINCDSRNSDSTKTMNFHDERDRNDPGRAAPPGRKVLEFIDAREVAPLASTWDMFNISKNASSTEGGLAIAVPGELRGLELAHQRHGKIPWAQVVEPAMKLARDGFTVGKYLAHEVEINEPKIRAHKHLLALLTKDHDSVNLLEEGDLLVQPELAMTLQNIMTDGADAIYQGPMAKKLVADISRSGGIITEDDLDNYRPVLRTPVVAKNIQGFNIASVGPPSSGGAAVLGALRFLSGYRDPYSFFADTVSKHRLIEASKNVFSIRMSLSDPAYNTNKTLSAVLDMVSNRYMETLRLQSSDVASLPMSRYGGSKWAQLADDVGLNVVATDASEGDRRRLSQGERHLRDLGYLEDRGTTHLSVVDKDRNSVSITSTVNTYFGSKVVSGNLGMVLNNQMDDFATPGKSNAYGIRPSESNYVAPGKRPLSSMSPTMVFLPKGKTPSTVYHNRSVTECDEDNCNELGDIVLILGASGGPKIISAVLQTIINYCILGMPLFEAVVSPRVHDQLLYHGAAVTTYEMAPSVYGPMIETTNRTLTALMDRGHRLLPVNYMGTVQAVGIDPETQSISAVSDIRKGGKPSGW